MSESKIQQAAAARIMMSRIGAEDGVLHQVETRERTPRDGGWDDLLAVAERTRLDRILNNRFTQQAAYAPPRVSASAPGEPVRGGMPVVPSSTSLSAGPG